MSGPTPVKLEKVDEKTLRIEWSDGLRSDYPVRLLRQLCPCAGCVDEVTGERTLDPDAVPADVKPLQIQPVGKYALGIRWSDGHDTGIYSFDLLRNIHFVEMGPGAREE